jgi:hypothetical protein
MSGKSSASKVNIKRTICCGGCGSVVGVGVVVVVVVNNVVVVGVVVVVVV